jgi:hypothetical protein
MKLDGPLGEFPKQAKHPRVPGTNNGPHVSSLDFGRLVGHGRLKININEIGSPDLGTVRKHWQDKRIEKLHTLTRDINTLAPAHRVKPVNSPTSLSQQLISAFCEMAFWAVMKPYVFGGLRFRKYLKPFTSKGILRRA